MKIAFALIWLEDWIDTCVLTYSGMSDSLRLHGLYPPNVLVRRLCSWNFSGKNTGVVSHFLLQGNFLTQGSNPCFLLWQADFYCCTTWEILKTFITRTFEGGVCIIICGTYMLTYYFCFSKNIYIFVTYKLEKV